MRVADGVGRRVRVVAALGWLGVIAAMLAGPAAPPAAADSTSRLKQIALHLAEASRIASAPGVHSLNVDTYLLNNGFQHVPANLMGRAVADWTMRRSLLLVYFAPDGAGAWRDYDRAGRGERPIPIEWWQSRMGVCVQLRPQTGAPGRQCFQFYRIDNVVVSLMIDQYGLMKGPGRVKFLKGDETPTATWGAAMRLQP